MFLTILHMVQHIIMHTTGLMLCFLLSLHPLLAHSLSFDISNFAAGTHNILYEGDATPVSGSMELTPITGYRVSRASYADPVRIWDSSTGIVADFTTRFSFNCTSLDANPSPYADGFTLFLAPFNDPISPNSGGGYFGLFNSTLTRKQMVIVEFDSYVNDWDPPMRHIGINNGSLSSSAYVSWDIRSSSGKQGDAVVTYNAATMNLSLVWSYRDAEVAGNSTFLIIDLRNSIPEWVRIGFSATTGLTTQQRNTISSWQFSSNMDSGVVAASPSRKEKTRITSLLVIVGVSLFVLMLGGVGIGFFFVKKKRSKSSALGKRNLFDSTNAELEKGALPIRFSFQELVVATNNFADENKLGRGGSGQVYKGLLANLGRVVAVKRILTESENSEKIFLNEAKIISRLIHRNLVQFIGWCHEGGSLLLVYDYMPNGSLDTHLFGNKRSLSWPVRYKIALGLASALHYLHEDAEQCVLHRDVKSANVLLDTDFSTKLGDFGLAKLIDPTIRSQLTTLVGTLGYLAPEYASEGKATKESDMFSFGVVALEIVCGRRTYEDGDLHMPLRKWILQLYSSGNILNAVDERLGDDFNREEIERLLMVGLRCTNPNGKERLEAQQVIKVLRGEMSMTEQPNDIECFLSSEQQECVAFSRNHLSSSLCDGR